MAGDAATGAPTTTSRSQRNNDRERNPIQRAQPRLTKDLTHRDDHHHHLRRRPETPRTGDGRAATVKRQMRLVLVGHGESDWTVAGRYTGTTVEPLVAEYDYGDYEGLTAE